MKELKKGMFARSLAGHDKGKLYVVLEAGERAVLLTDGKQRPIEKPKQKNRIHIRPDLTESGVFEEGGKIHPAEQNAAIRKAIRIREEKVCQKQT